MSASGLNGHDPRHRPWLVPHGTRPLTGGASVDSAFLAGLRDAHVSGTALSGAAEAWASAAGAALLSHGFVQLRREAEEGVRRIEYILAGLRREARGGASWMARRDLFIRVASDDATLVKTAAWTLGCMAAGALRLQRLAHNCGEYQAARLLEMSVDEQIGRARQLMEFVHSAAPAGIAADSLTNRRTQ
ncbi:MAG TPA: DUF892 family protein [Roseomonas sp.]